MRGELQHITGLVKTAPLQYTMDSGGYQHEDEQKEDLRATYLSKVEAQIRVEIDAPTISKPSNLSIPHPCLVTVLEQSCQSDSLQGHSVLYFRLHPAIARHLGVAWWQ